MSTPYTGEKPMHKHRDLIIAWANGAEIQWRDKDPDSDREWRDTKDPWFWNELNMEFRIKPESRPDVVYYYHKEFVERELRPYGRAVPAQFHKDALKLVWDGETGKLKLAEVLC